MKRSIPATAGFLLLMVSACACDAFAEQAGEEEDLIRRGRYIAHHVAMCVECHTPRDEDGSFLEDKLFHGAPIPVEKPPWVKTWAYKSAGIAGLPGWTREEAIQFLQTGKRTNGVSPSLPMPPFRLDREDAEAVTAYLKHLPEARS